MAHIPQTMRSLMAPKECKPDQYEVRQVPTPTITDPEQVLLRIHAVGMNTLDPQIVSGELGMFLKPDYPAPIGVEGAGIVVAVGSAVKSLKVGDEVYGFNMAKPLGGMKSLPGFASDYALAKAPFLLPKPPHISFEEAAALSGFVVTAIQTIRRGLQLGGLESTELEGKTVFIPGALSGTGSVMVQVAKNVFGAKSIISTVSTPKLGLVEHHLPGLVDQVIDYKKQNVGQAVGPGRVDFAVSTQRTSLDDCIQTLKHQGGVLMDITAMPPKEKAKEMIGADKMTWYIGLVLDLMQLYYVWKLWGTDIKHEMLSGSPEIREDLEKAGEVIARGKVKAVMRVIDLDDLEGVKKGCEELRTGKGGIGKLVIKLV